MILLSGHSLAQARRVPMEALSLQLRERDSSATMTPADMTGIGTDSWLLDDTGPGAGIVWRVASINRNYATRTPTVQLEHMISSLRDRLLFGEVNAKTITGSTTATSCTAEQAVRYILGKQGDWALGQMDYNVSNPYKFDGDTLYDALETVTASLEDACWTYDFTVYPFRLNIVRKPSGVACEMRPGRNLTTISKSISRNGMYTRFYPIGKDDLHLSTEYVEKNADIYGVISKTETDQSKDSEAELRRWADELLERHAEPTVSVTAEGLELAEATGESLDKLTLGRICRIPLEEFGTTIEERITELSYPDKLHAPEVVRITLANNRQDVTSIIADAIKKGGGGRRSAARQDKEDHAWFEDTNDHVAMCAIGIIGKDAKGEPNWVRLSRLEVDENGIFGEVQSVQNDMVIANTRIDQNEERIKLEAKQFEDGIATMQGRITVQADRITQEVTNRQNGDRELSGRITVEAGKISQIVSAVGADGKVTAASIVLAINNAGDSEARIDAKKVYIGSQRSTTVINGKLNASDVTATYLAAKFANTSVLSTRYAFSNVYECDTLICNDYTCAVEDAYHALQIVQDGNNYKLQGKHFYSSDWADIGTFSRAVSSASWSWVGGAPRVTLSPQGQNFTGVPINGITFSASTKQWATDKKSFTQDFYCYDANSRTVYTENLSINTRESYEAGYTDGQASVSHSIDIPTGQIYTSDRYTGTRLNTLKTQYEKAKSDGDYVMFRVDCGGTSKWYYMEP